MMKLICNKFRGAQNECTRLYGIDLVKLQFNKRRKIVHHFQIDFSHYFRKLNPPKISNKCNSNENTMCIKFNSNNH